MSLAGKSSVRMRVAGMSSVRMRETGMSSVRMRGAEIRSGSLSSAGPEPVNRSAKLEMTGIGIKSVDMSDIKTKGENRPEPHKRNKRRCI